MGWNNFSKKGGITHEAIFFKILQNPKKILQKAGAGFLEIVKIQLWSNRQQVFKRIKFQQ